MSLKKFSLEELRIKSFVTEISNNKKPFLIGGDQVPTTTSTGSTDTDGEDCLNLLPSESQCGGPNN